MMTDQLLYIIIGGGLGSVCRYLISEVAPHYYKGSFPLGTFTANAIGCLVIGLFVALFQHNVQLDAFLITGFCGGFTTFSSFSKETFLLVQQKRIKMAFLYVGSSIITGIIAVLIGYTIAGGHF